MDEALRAIGPTGE